MEQVNKIGVDLSKIKTAIQAGIPLSVTTYTLPHEMEIYMRDVLSDFLSELNQIQITEYLTYCLEELINNAKKANTKRIYFKERNLDLNNPRDYERGMRKFKEETVTNIKYYLLKQKQAGLYIKLILQTRHNMMKIEIRNNSELTYFEYKRIHDKISRAQQYTSVEEVVNNILDESEGAGLGLIIMILMLEKIGLTEDNFQVISECGETITRLILPFSEKKQKEIALFSTEFARLIEDLPQFPENITTINRMINDPDSRISDIAMLISQDVSLASELLRMANSAAFGLAYQCRSIIDAVKIIGLRGIRNMLFSIGSMQILMKASDSTKDLWTHSYRVAFYAYNLGRNFFTDPSERFFIEDCYVCGLLHDIGKVIFRTARLSLLDQVQEACETKGLSGDVFEKLTAGVNHGEIGALIAEKWNFPELIVNVIRYHHFPEDVPESMRKVTSVVYLADMMTHYLDETVDFYQFDHTILSMFKIKKEEQIKVMAQRMEEAFQKIN